MKTLVDHLAQYAAYHRDRRNIATHFIGIPLIVLALALLLSRPGMDYLGLWLSPALLPFVALAVFYLRLDRLLGLVMGGLLLLCLWAGQALAQQSIAVWLSTGLGLFVLGWIIQFVGHYYEGRKPAFFDDVMGLAVGPLFVVAEMAFALGWLPQLRQAVEERAGPTCIRQRHASPSQP
jgi:uncharacterized membrane protein YGL010W